MRIPRHLQRPAAVQAQDEARYPVPVDRGPDTACDAEVLDPDTAPLPVLAAAGNNPFLLPTPPPAVAIGVGDVAALTRSPRRKRRKAAKADRELWQYRTPGRLSRAAARLVDVMIGQDEHPRAGVSRPTRTRDQRLLGLVLVVFAVIFLGAVTVMNWAVGHLAYLLSVRGWPTTNLADWLGILFRPGDPLGGWPDVDGHPAAGLFYALAVPGWLAYLAVWLLAIVHVWRAMERATRGVATAAQENDRVNGVTAAALIGRADTIRPALCARVNDRPIEPAEMGTLIGRSTHTRQQIFRPIDASTIVQGLTGSGKTTSIGIPTCREFETRQVISSTKVDILRTTWDVAADRGGAAAFDPAGLAGGVVPMLRWTPIAGCEDGDIAEDRQKALMPELTSGSGGDANKDFKVAGASVVRAMLHAAALGDRTVREMLAWAYNPVDDEPEKLIRRGGRGHDLYADHLAEIRRWPERQRYGAFMTVQGALETLSVPSVLALIDHRPSSSFSTPRWLVDGHESLYLLSHKTQHPGAARIVKWLMSDILDSARKLAARSRGARLDPPLLILADEATNAAELGDWPTVLSDSRGWGISVMMLIQARQLLRGAYGQQQGDAIWSAAAARIMVGGGAGGQDTRELADSFGKSDVTTLSRNLSGSGGSAGTRWQENRTVAELMNLPPGRAILSAAQMPPVEIELVPWWDRPTAAATRWAADTYDNAHATGRSLIGQPHVRRGTP